LKGEKMRLAIFMGSIIIAQAINPQWIYFFGTLAQIAIFALIPWCLPMDIFDFALIIKRPNHLE